MGFQLNKKLETLVLKEIYLIAVLLRLLQNESPIFMIRYVLVSPTKVKQETDILFLLRDLVLHRRVSELEVNP